MPGLVLGVVVTFALSLILSRTFLRMRCRGVGTPFGPRARYWSTFIVVGTAAVSTAVGVLIVLASSHSGAAYAGIIVAPGLLLSKVPPQRDLDMQPRTSAHVLTLPFSRLYDRIGEDMQAWCDYRMAAAKSEPRYLGHTAQYYWNQMGRVKDPRTRDIMDTRRKSIVHKMDCVRLIDLDASQARLNDAFQQHPSTQHLRDCTDEYLIWLAKRLESDAESELFQFLARAYQLGYDKMLVYPFRPDPPRPGAPPPRAEPVEPVEPVTPDL
jgi:hypothetical protein